MRKEIWVEKTLEVGCLKCQHFSRMVNFQTWIIPDIHPLVFVYKDDETRSSQPDLTRTWSEKHWRLKLLQKIDSTEHATSVSWVVEKNPGRFFEKTGRFFKF